MVIPIIREVIEFFCFSILYLQERHSPAAARKAIVSFKIRVLPAIHKKQPSQDRWAGSPKWVGFHLMFMRNFLSHFKEFVKSLEKRDCFDHVEKRVCFDHVVGIFIFSMRLQEDCSNSILLYKMEDLKDSLILLF